MYDAPGAWDDALLAARVLAAGGPALGGVHVRARAGPVRDAWLSYLQARVVGRPWRRITPSTAEARLAGGLDVGATLAAGRPVSERGLLAEADGGLVALAMAERTSPPMAGVIAAVLDSGAVAVERDGVSARHDARFALIALDEGADEEERLPAALADRLALRIDLEGVSWRRTAAVEAPEPAPGAPVDADLSDEMLAALAEATARTGWRSVRRLLSLARVCRIVAALDGAAEVAPAHAAAAIRLVIGIAPAAQAPREEESPSHAEEPSEADPPPPDHPGEDVDTPPEGESAIDIEALADLLVAPETAIRPSLSPMTSPRRAGRMAKGGTSGEEIDRSRRGRPIGTTPREPWRGARPNLMATLRAAAPWQPIRRRERALAGRPVDIRKSDFRYIRLRERAESTAIFAVDASGSTALDRLGEAKGAVELLLADCYVRRDSVALVAFRGRGAEIELVPTRSLVRAKRALSGLVGGGPTPLASGLTTALDLAAAERRRGRSPLVVLLTDGSGNIAMDGTADRGAAGRDTATIARAGAVLDLPIVLIDIARRPREAARALARTLRADYHALPRADASAVSGLVSGYLKAR